LSKAVSDSKIAKVKRSSSRGEIEPTGNTYDESQRVVRLLFHVLAMSCSHTFPFCQGSEAQDDYSMPQDAVHAASDDEAPAEEEDASYEEQTGASAEDQPLYSDEVRVELAV
jgi:hypothetical protein